LVSGINRLDPLDRERGIGPLIGSVGSVAWVGSIGWACSVFSVGSAASVASVLSFASKRSRLSARSTDSSRNRPMGEAQRRAAALCFLAACVVFLNR
jgi:hypothetical protein